MSTPAKFPLIIAFFATLFHFETATARNIILFIGDGMGFEHVQAGRLHLHGSDSTLLFMENLAYAGEAVTALPGGAATDSATSATALATGYQHPTSGVISMNSSGAPVVTILEKATDHGQRTGIITTDVISGATPGAFGAHEPSRDRTTEILNDYLWGDVLHGPSLPNVLFGGGYLDSFRLDAIGLGYQFAGTASALDDVIVDRKLGLFNTGSLTRENDRTLVNTEPRLDQMVTHALTLLSRDNQGFFLMVEGALIDKISHEGNTLNAKQDLPPEVAQLNAAVQAAYAWLQTHALLDDTLILVTADHETGALTVPDGQIIAPGSIPEMTFGSTGHTTRNVPIYASWPPALEGTIIDNTETFFVMEDWLAGLPGTPPVIQSLEVVEITGTSARVRWYTREPSTTHLECAGIRADDYSRVQNHEVQLSGLIENTLFTAIVRSSDLAGFVSSADIEFGTAAPDVNAYVVADPVGKGTVTGSYTVLAPPVDGLLQTITEVPDGVGSSLNVIYTLGTTVSPAEVISVQLYVNLTWANSDRFAEELILEAWDSTANSFELLGYNVGGAFALGPQHLYWNDAASRFCTDVRLRDSTSVSREKKGKVSVDVLYAEIVAGAADTTPPEVPYNLHVAESGVELTAQLTWASSDPTDVAFYRIYRGEVQVGTSITANFVDQVSSEDDYRYSVTAVDTVGNESVPCEAVTIHLPNRYQPSVPSDLIAVAGDSQVALSWKMNSEPDLDGYNVYRRSQGESAAQLNGEPIQGNSFVDSNVMNGTTYYYAVEAVDMDGKVSDLCAEVPATPSASPSLFVDTEGALSSAGRNWKASATVTVFDQQHRALVGASVLGQWFLDQVPLQEPVHGVTDATGAVVFAAPVVKATSGQVFRFLVSDAQFVGYQFDASGSVVEYFVTVPSK